MSDRYFSQEEEDYIREHFRDYGSDIMAREMEKVFGHKFSIFHLKRYRKENGLQSGLTGQFKKGCSSWTKGRHPKDFCTPEAYARSCSTRFKSGHEPSNMQQVGTVVRHADGYYWKKTRDDLTPYRLNWKQVHRLVWEEANGPIPRGKHVIFLNGDKSDCRIENLAMVSNRERGFMRNFICEDKDVQKIGLLVAQLKERTEAPQKRKKHEK